MNDRVIDLKYGKLHLIKTKKFRTINIKVLLKDEIRKEEITKRNFLTDYLVLTTKKYPTRKELSLKIQDLYSLYISSYNTRIGNYFVTRFHMSLLNPKYTDTKMLDESISMLHDILFEPNVNNNAFDPNLFKIIKKNIETEIKTVKENTKMYANIRMLENMGKEAYSYHGYGYLEDLEKIDPKNLYEYYQEFLKTCEVDIYVIGDFDSDEMIHLIQEKLNFKTFKKPKIDIYLKHKQIRKRPKTVIENMALNQSKLAIGCKYTSLSDFERKYVINLYNMILGGGFTSKFMKIIREEKSLAYYIHSSVNKADNLLLIQSGISQENFLVVVKNIKKIMKSIQKGDVSEESLERTKIEYLSVLEESYEEQDNIVENFIATEFLDLDSYEIRKEMIQKVKIEDIINISKKIFIDTIYLLKGEQDEKVGL